MSLYRYIRLFDWTRESQPLSTKCIKKHVTFKLNYWYAPENYLSHQRLHNLSHTNKQGVLCHAPKWNRTLITPMSKFEMKWKNHGREHFVIVFKLSYHYCVSEQWFCFQTFRTIQVIIFFSIQQYGRKC